MQFRQPKRTENSLDRDVVGVALTANPMSAKGIYALIKNIEEESIDTL
jgi:hypothetical protein